MKNKILVATLVLIFIFSLTSLADARVKTNATSLVPQTTTQDDACLWKKENVSGVNRYYLKDLRREYINFADPSTGQPALTLRGSGPNVLLIEGRPSVGTTIQIMNHNLGRGVSVGGAQTGVAISATEYGVWTTLAAPNATGYDVNGYTLGATGYLARDVATAFKSRNTQVAADLQGSFILRDGSFTLSDNAGQGNAYACFDGAGRLFRNMQPCFQNFNTK